MSKFTDLLKSAAAFINPAYHDKLMQERRQDVIHHIQDVQGWVLNGESKIATRDRAACGMAALRMGAAWPEILAKINIIHTADKALANELWEATHGIEYGLHLMHDKGEVWTEGDDFEVVDLAEPSEFDNHVNALTSWAYEAQEYIDLGMRDDARKYVETMDNNRTAITKSLLFVQAIDPYRAEVLENDIRDMRDNLISVALHGVGWMPAMDSGLEVPNQLPPLAAAPAKPPAPKI